MLSWPFLLVGGIVLFPCVGGLLKMAARKDLAPDFLGRMCGGRYFDRDGFCFTLGVTPRDGRCMVTIFFQNRYDRPLRGRVAIQPSRELFMRADIQGFAVDIPCEAAGVGKVEFPWPIPAKYQGKRMKFDVGADVMYPEGRGKMLRFSSGIWIRGNTQFGNPLTTTLTVAAAMGGAFVISSPASVTMDLPKDVAEVADPAVGVELTTVWKLGDSLEPATAGA
jgi:hypothetical protein